MRSGFASLLLWMLWLLGLRLLSYGQWTALRERAVAFVLTAFPLILVVCIVLAVIAARRHSKWWLVSAALSAILCWQWWQAIHVST